jgi:hypothetical protein
LQFQEDTGNPATHYVVRWNAVGTTWPVNMGWTDDEAPAEPQVQAGGLALLTAQRPPEGILRLEYLPTRDSLPRTPVLVGKARTATGDVETASFGQGNDVRLLFWAALFRRVVFKEPWGLEQAYSFISVQEFLTDHVALGHHLRFYLRETQLPDDYWPCESTPPMTQAYEESQKDKSGLKYQWTIEVSYSAE